MLKPIIIVHFQNFFFAKKPLENDPTEQEQNMVTDPPAHMQVQCSIGTNQSKYKTRTIYGPIELSVEREIMPIEYEKQRGSRHNNGRDALGIYTEIGFEC